MQWPQLLACLHVASTGVPPSVHHAAGALVTLSASFWHVVNPPPNHWLLTGWIAPLVSWLAERLVCVDRCLEGHLAFYSFLVATPGFPAQVQKGYLQRYRRMREISKKTYLKGRLVLLAAQWWATCIGDL